MNDISANEPSRVSDLPRGDGYDLVVVGAGSAGLSVAAAASQLGVSVAFVEADRMGGECLNIGCVPSKSLLRCAHVAQTVREAARFGVNASAPTVDSERVHAYVQSRIAALAPHDSAERFRSLGCHVFFGRAQFLDSKNIEVTTDRETFQIAGRRFVVAIGSSPKTPSIPGLNEVGFRTNNDVFDMRSIPRRLAVLGGGPIGIEMAQAFANLGSEVVVVQSRERILPRDDRDLALRLQAILERQGIRILTEAKTAAVERRDEAKILRIEHSSQTEKVPVDEILVAAGRFPNTSMNLEAAGVAFDANGIRVNAKLQTTAKHIYACGDVVGPHRFTHMAGYQAGIVVANAIFRFPKKVSDRAIPWCTFTDPELAHVGMTNADADAKGVSCSTITFDLAKCDRAVCDSAEGMVKIVLDKRDRLLGAQILAPRAGEMIHEFALLISSGTKLSALRDTIHCYPTYSDAVKQAVSEVYRPRLFSNRTRTLVRWIRRILG
jgi:pyruvate/2-oxoglutarate dehydrogenase complex dihydrolipoamide dehydrogenase (E3) component